MIITLFKDEELSAMLMESGSDLSPLPMGLQHRPTPE
jgi:hypothetical protein